MKKHKMGAVLAIIVIAVCIGYLELYSADSCVMLWNNCQHECHGMPCMVVYEDGITRVECWDSEGGCGCYSQDPYWISPPCAKQN